MASRKRRRTPARKRTTRRRRAKFGGIEARDAGVIGVSAALATATSGLAEGSLDLERSTATKINAALALAALIGAAMAKSRVLLGTSIGLGSTSARELGVMAGRKLRTMMGGEVEADDTPPPPPPPQSANVRPGGVQGLPEPVPSMRQEVIDAEALVYRDGQWVPAWG